MPRLLLLLSLLGLGLPAPAATPVTLDQLREFLAAPSTRKLTDAQIADRLSSVELIEQVTVPALAHLLAGLRVGPETAEQLQLLAAASIFADPPTSDELGLPPPNPAAQQQMLRSATDYVRTTLHHLPDFLADRVTTCYDSVPRESDRNQEKIIPRLRWVRHYQREITFRNGTELAASAASDSPDPARGFSTWGEFGPILDIVLGDSFSGAVTWKRWERSNTGVQIAVFHYAVPQSASHYLIDFCCYKPSESSGWMQFRERPAYHGDLYIDPQTGLVERITLQADLNEGDPVSANRFVVQYGRVEIAGKNYVCPLSGIAIAVIDPMPMQSTDREPLERYLNEVTFSNYHKFGSTAQIVASPQAENRTLGKTSYR
ncbi:MAG TPA: hypothetical protein VKR52_18655 [Terracidiphilus sp.]|nr:hypothetical protein [Terracidiphilus sp.]